MRMDPMDPMDYVSTVKIIVSSSGTIKSVMEQINFQINYPVTWQKLIHNGRKLHWTDTIAQFSTQNGDSIYVEHQPLEDTISSITGILTATQKFLNDCNERVCSSQLWYPSIELKQIMDHLLCCEQIDNLVVLVCKICTEPMDLEEELLCCIRKILKRPQPRDLQILMSTCVPATLSKLCQYAWLPDFNEIDCRVFQYFLDLIVSLPKQLHVHCQDALMESFNFLCWFRQHGGSDKSLSKSY